MLTTAALAVVFFAFAVWASGPSRPARTLPPSPPLRGDPTVRGAFHIHTIRSDGALSKDDVAAEAARAGLQFAIFTDHGDGTRQPDAPEYFHGVLCLDAVEISTNGGHYIGLDIPRAPYPLGGDADAVAEDVARLGGFGVAAHPMSRRSELAWSDWTIPIDGLEWLNTDSEWRDEGRLRLSRAFLDYLWRPSGALASLFDRPADALHKWDELTATRPLVALAGHDAHGGVGAEPANSPGRRLHVPSYEAAFRTFSLHATVARPFNGDSRQDAESLIRAIREGRVSTVIDAIASPGAFDFTATAGGETVGSGASLTAPGPATFSVRAAVPPGAKTILFQNGGAVAQAEGGVLDHQTSSPGVFRVEILAPQAPGSPPVPWLVGNPIYRYARAVDTPMTAAPLPVSILPLMQRQWRVESDPGSSGSVDADGQTVTMLYRLREGGRTSQFVALAVDLGLVPIGVNTLVLRGRSDQPMRLSAQLRFAGPEDDRWGRSLYLDPTEREFRIPIDRLRAIGNTSVRPSAVRATSMLFVIDLTNAVPGASGSLTLRDVALARQDPR